MGYAKNREIEMHYAQMETNKIEETQTDKILAKFEKWDKQITPLFFNYLKGLGKLIITFIKSIIIYIIVSGIYLSIYSSFGFEKTLIILLVGVIIYNNQLIAFAMGKK